MSASCPVRILHLEDCPNDAELVREALAADRLEVSVEWVENREGFVKALEGGGWSLILADYRLPEFDGITALGLAREKCPEVPFIFVSGTIGEERAVAALKSGATDYVLKNGLQRLAPSVRRALTEAEERDRRGVAEAELRKSEEKYRTLVTHIPDILWSADRDGNLYFLTPRFRDVTGFEPVDLFRDGRTLWFDKIRPEDGARVKEAYASLWSRGTYFDLEYAVRRPDGALVWLRDRAVNRFVYDGVEYVFGLMTDVTARRELDHRLLEGQKLEVVGRLAGGVSHDFNNLLTVVSGQADLLLARLPQGDPSRGALLEINESARRAIDLSRQLLAFSRPQAVESRRVDLNAVVSGMESLIRRLIPADIEIAFRLDSTPWQVRGDSSHLEQVLLNLAVNARDAMPRGGRMTIETGKERADDASSERVVLSVSDTGVGMDEGTRGRIFEPFFTTKDKGRGTGLGLATVDRIIKAAGGSISVTSEPGKGSTFRVALPRCEGTEKRREGGVAIPNALPGGGETILLIEDSESVRRVAREILLGRGYTVLEASHGDEAIRLAGEKDREIHLLLSDLVLPGLGGPEIAAALRESRPGLKILFISGYFEGDPSGRGTHGLNEAFLQKPFSISALAVKVREVLDGKRANE